jgi:DNA primase large subunit
MVMVNTNSPIVVVEGNDVTIHASVKDAESWLEPWWVEKQLGKVYDAEGRSFRLEVHAGRVRIMLDELQTAHAEELKSLLKNFLNTIAEPAVTDASCDLLCLVRACEIRQKRSRGRSS